MTGITVGDRVMVSPDHPTFAREWLGMWGHVVSEAEAASVGYPHRVWRVRVGGQVGEMTGVVRDQLGRLLILSEAVLVHPD